jgi:hypothetical protein
MNTNKQNELDYAIVQNRAAAFDLNLKDHWTREDFDLSDKLSSEYRRLLTKYRTLFKTAPKYLKNEYRNETSRLIRELETALGIA